MSKDCVIVGSRPVGRELLSLAPPGAFILAVDAGWRRAEELGLAPSLVLGDFDSAPPPEHAAEILRLPAEKDDTDTFFAARWALERGFDNFVILGGLGGRFDHTLANLQTLLHLARQGAACLLADSGVEIRCMGPGTLRLPARPERYLSVFAAGGAARGVCLRGVEYPLRQAVLAPDIPLGVSNEFREETAEISCSEGYLYVMTVQKDGRGGAGHCG